MEPRLKIIELKHVTNNQIEVVIFLAQAGALWAFLAFAVKDYALDRLRQNLFTIRASLFDSVSAENGSFLDQDYLHLRSYINQVIKRGHMVTASRAIIATSLARLPFVTGGVSSHEISEDINSYVQTLTTLEESNQRVKDVRKQVHTQIAQYYALTSPIFLGLMLVFIPAVICSMGLVGMRFAAERAFNKFLARDVDREIVQCEDLDGKLPA